VVQGGHASPWTFRGASPSGLPCARTDCVAKSPRPALVRAWRSKARRAGRQPALQDGRRLPPTLATSIREVLNLVVALAPDRFDDGGLRKTEGSVPRSGAADNDDLIAVRRADTVFSRLRARPYYGLLRISAVLIVAAALVAGFLQHLSIGHTPAAVPRLAEPGAIAGQPLASGLAPADAPGCAQQACTTSSASAADLAELRAYIGAGYDISGDRVRDRHGLLQGLSVTVSDDKLGYGVEISAIRSGSARANWDSVSSRPGLMVTHWVLRTRRVLWLVESTLLSDCIPRMGSRMWNLFRTGANATLLHI
jgi:hypothetical protein